MEKKPRPKGVKSRTIKAECGCGHLYVIIGKVDNELFEIFTLLGKAGGCAYAQNEALTRSISLGLRYGIPVSEYIRQLRDIKCPNPVYVEGEIVFSCAHAIAKLLEKEEKNNEDYKHRSENTT